MLGKLFLFVLLLKTATCTDDFSFNGFKGVSLSLDGAAAFTSDGLLVLTNNTKQLKGHAFYSAPIKFKRSPLGRVKYFSTTFVFAIVPEYPDIGCCGFTFTLSPSKDFSRALATKYMGLFNSSNNGDPSDHIVAIEFDTVDNPEDRDINDNHVGIDINSLISSKFWTAGFVSNEDGEFKNLRLIGGKPIQVWIDYDGLEMQLNVTLSPLGMPRPNLPVLSSTVNLSAIVLDQMYVGFCSSTGAAYSYHYILGWSFKMNGKARELDLSSLPPLPQVARSSKRKHKTLWISLSVAILVLVLMIAAGVITYVVITRKKYSEIVEDWEEDFETHRASYKDLFKATKGFKDKNLLGSGGFGRVYRGFLPSSKLEVAVKRISHESRQGMKEFVAEIVSLGKLRHRNLVQLLGYCRRKGELLLVYDYMPNGSLDKFLFYEDKPALGWNQRFRIIKGVASGLLYLHEDWDQVVIHRDVKASNVLLDSDMNGRLGDFGLAKLYSHGSVPQTSHVVGTPGYIAPELSRTRKATTTGDVFAFGAFLLEVACGRRPIEPNKPEGEQILVNWVLANWKKSTILETRDRRLGEDYVAEQLELVLKLGLFCSIPLPTSRPSMRQVTQFLHGDIPLPDLQPHLLSPSNSALASDEGVSVSACVLSYPSLTSTTSVLFSGR